MATTKNITMKQFNGTNYDILYPKTKVTQIDGFNDSIAKIVPVGSIYWYASETIPNGFLLCDGSEISRTDYASLFAVIGVVFGAGNGKTTFNLPNLSAAFIRGAGTQDGYSATFGQKQEATNIRQPSTVGNADKKGGYVNGPNGNQGLYTDMYLFSVRPFNIALTPIIKY